MTARIQVPAKARRGEVIEIRNAIQHPMETGFRLDDGGRAIPKSVVNKLVCRYNGVEIFRAEMGSGIPANPFLDFSRWRRRAANSCSTRSTTRARPVLNARH